MLMFGSGGGLFPPGLSLEEPHPQQAVKTIKNIAMTIMSRARFQVDH